MTVGQAGESRLWYRHAKPSGYGDLREHVTKFDRDIESVFLREVEKHWPGKTTSTLRTFVSNLTRSIYWSCRLGDNTWSCRLVVDGSNESSATEGSWVAFYPDVPHKVKTITNERYHSEKYRAVLALKIFRDDMQVLSGDSLLSMDSELCAAAEQLLANLEV
ncbi:hypothetical protein K435DRAFT_876585 [Dendrothele bispora CBS 962.96]|uniref:Uncharacterized protein n=1 Tax=Dendrothele bispora (strain CBS 962.96) TaxID=1314807 RepID=A0A4S8KRV6_DENBC|nr:hypothetical protein K435DRAFT_876585 [Dendrothele bispora CBS 962.96]